MHWRKRVCVCVHAAISASCASLSLARAFAEKQRFLLALARRECGTQSVGEMRIRRNIKKC